MRAILCAVLIGLGATQSLSQDRTPHQYAQERMPQGMLDYYEPHPWGPAPHPFSSWCCNHNDCAFAKPGSITWTPEGYKVMLPDGFYQLVTEDSPAVRHEYEPGFENEGRAAACIMSKGGNSAEWLGNRSPGALDTQSQFYVRCLYLGKSGQ